MIRFLVILFSLLTVFGCETQTTFNSDSSAEVFLVSNSEKTVLFSNHEISWSIYLQNNQIILEAVLSDGWKLYSSFNTNFMGPMPTLISFQKNEHYELVGILQESNVFNPENAELKYFKNKAIFTQEIAVNSGEEFALSGTVNYMICNAEGCQPPTELQFSLNIKL